MLVITKLLVFMTQVFTCIRYCVTIPPLLAISVGRGCATDEWLLPLHSGLHFQERIGWVERGWGGGGERKEREERERGKTIEVKLRKRM